MKTLRTLLPLLAFFCVLQGRAQLTFTMATSLCEGSSATLTAQTGTLSALMYTWAALPSGPVFSSTNTSTTVVTFPSAGIYSVGVGILTMNGFAYATNTIQIHAAPVLTAVTSPTSICSGQSTTLTASGASSYTWSPGGSLSATSGSQVVATPATPTSYTITGDNGTGCTGTISTAVQVYPQASSFSITPTSQSVCAGFNATLTAFSGASYTWTGTGINPPLNTQSIVVGAGTYSVEAQGANCVYSASITIFQQQPISVLISASSPTSCIASNFPLFSNSVTLTATGASSYIWFPYNPLLPGNTSTLAVRLPITTCFTVTGSTPTCSNSAVACVSIVPQFFTQLSTTALPMCIGESHTVSVEAATGSAGAPFTYAWNEPLNAPPISISSYTAANVSVYPQNSCTYSVEVKDKDGCISKTGLLAVNVSTCTGIGEEALNSLQLYPNPAKTQVNIRSTVTGAYTLQLIDLQGKVILQHSVPGESGKTTAIDLGSVSPGVYFVKLNAPGQPARMQKMIVEK